MDQTSAITSQLIRIQSKFYKIMWVGVCVHACDFLLIYVGALLFLHCMHLLHLHVQLCVFTHAFLTSSSYDPYGSYQWDTNWTCFEPAVYVCIWASEHLSISLDWTKKFSVTLKPATCLSWRYKASFSPDLSSKDASLFLMTSDIFSAIYFQALMRCNVCGWGGSLGAPVWAHIHVIRPYMEWHLAWPCGAPSGSRELICSQPGMPDIWSQTC